MRVKRKQLFTVTFSFRMKKCFYQMWLCVLLNWPSFYPSAFPSWCDVLHHPCPSIWMILLCEDMHSQTSSSCLLGRIYRCFHQQTSTESKDTKAAMWLHAFTWLFVFKIPQDPAFLNLGDPKPVVIMLFLQAELFVMQIVLVDQYEKCRSNSFTAPVITASPVWTV